MNYEMPKMENVCLAESNVYAEGPENSSCGKTKGCCFDKNEESSW